jgi:hypothetical protein
MKGIAYTARVNTTHTHTHTHIHKIPGPVSPCWRNILENRWEGNTYYSFIRVHIIIHNTWGLCPPNATLTPPPAVAEDVQYTTLRTHAHSQQHRATHTLDKNSTKARPFTQQPSSRSRPHSPLRHSFKLAQPHPLGLTGREINRRYHTRERSSQSPLSSPVSTCKFRAVADKTYTTATVAAVLLSFLFSLCNLHR